MGRAARALADRVIVTSDNPRSEDPAAIVEEILAGTGPDVELELDRRAAIARAIATAEPGDVVVVAGKGHEQGQEFAGGRKEPFDDREVVRERAARGQPRGRHRTVIDLSAGRGRRGRRRRASCAGDPERARSRPRGGRLARARGRRPVRRPPRRARADGAQFAPAALAAGAWGVLVGAGRAEAALAAAAADRRRRARAAETRSPRSPPSPAPGGASSPARPSASPARRGRPRPRTSSPPCSARTGAPTPTARTSTPRSACRCRCSRPSAGTEALVLEMAMRGEGQIAELARDRRARRGRGRQRRARCTSSCSAPSSGWPRPRPS